MPESKLFSHHKTNYLQNEWHLQNKYSWLNFETLVEVNCYFWCRTTILYFFWDFTEKRTFHMILWSFNIFRKLFIFSLPPIYCHLKRARAFPFSKTFKSTCKLDSKPSCMCYPSRIQISSNFCLLLAKIHVEKYSTP